MLLPVVRFTDLVDFWQEQAPALQYIIQKIIFNLLFVAHTDEPALRRTLQYIRGTNKYFWQNNRVNIFKTVN